MRGLAAVLLGISGLAVVALVLAGCGGDDDGGATPGATAEGSATTAGGTATRAQGDPATAFRALTIPEDLTSGFEAGRADAKVVLEVFEDFQCPHCLNFTLQFEPLLMQEYVVPGKVKFVFRNLPILGPESGNAAIAAACAAEQDGFWPYHKELFLAQADAGQLTDEKLEAGRFTAERLMEMAGKAALDTAAFETCLRGDAIIDRVNEDIRAAQAAGFRGTPSFLLNGKTVTGPTDAAGWRVLLDGALAAP